MIQFERKSTVLIGVLAAACSGELMASNCNYGGFYSQLSYSEAEIHQAKSSKSNLYTQSASKKSSSASQALLDKISSYLKLEDDWDGYGGVPPEKMAVVAAINFVVLLEKEGFPSPKTMLSGDGEVGLYWDSNGVFVDVGFEEAGVMSFYAKTSAAEVFGDDELGSSVIPKELSNVLGMLSSLSTIKSTISDYSLGSYLEFG
jgi:hypothetical protein